MSTHAAQFRRLLSGPTFVMPGAYNAYSAMLIEQAGFPAYYVSGAALANGEFGKPDIGLTTLPQAAEHARRIAQAVQIPGLTDADTCFDDPIGSVCAFEASGIAGMHIEDQVEQKRCGHLEGKQLVSMEEMQQRIAQAVQARRDRDFVIMVRTDAAAVEGVDAAIARAKAYVVAGADAIFAEALRTEEEFRAFRKQVDVPLLANMTEFGKTPYFTAQQFSSWGYNMVIFPMTLFRIAAGACVRALAELKASGTQQALLDQMQTRKQLYEVLNYQP